jgi:hypothetical protein
MEGGAVGHNFERDPPRDHSCQVRFLKLEKLVLLFKTFYSIKKDQLKLNI